MEKRAFFKRLLKAVAVRFNQCVYWLCKFVTRIIRAIKIRSELKYCDRKHWENY